MMTNVVSPLFKRMPTKTSKAHNCWNCFTLTLHPPTLHVFHLSISLSIQTFSSCFFSFPPVHLFLSLLSLPVTLSPPSSLGLAPVIFQTCHLLTKWLCWERLTALIFSRSFFCVEPYSKTWVIGLHSVLIKTLSDWLKTTETRLLHHGEAALSHCCVWRKEATCSPKLDRVNLKMNMYFCAICSQHTRNHSLVHHHKCIVITC